MPPRGVKSPTTVIRFGWQLHEVVEDLVRRRFVEHAALAIAEDVQLQRFQLDTEFVGDVVDTDFTKSGWPVIGQSDVNSGAEMAISYSRPGRGFGNVSIFGLDIVSDLIIWRLKSAGSGGLGQLTVAEPRASILRLPLSFRGLPPARAAGLRL